MDAQITIGTLIHGTLRDEDLQEAFIGEIARLSDDMHPKLTEVGAMDTDDNYTESDLTNDLMDILQEYAPAHMYFGAHEGDGADFGWWAEDIELAGCEIVKLDDENVIDVDCQVHVNVNDHGNVTVSELRGAEIWSAY